MIFTRFVNTYSIAIWGLYLLLALPFYAHIDKYTMICFLFSTLSDYFSGVGEGVWGLHSILIILIVINIVAKRRGRLSIQGLLWPTLLIGSFWLSYYHSPFHYINGAYSMTYVVIISMFIMGFVTVKSDTLSNYLPVLTSIIVLYFLLVLIVNGNYTITMLSIRSDINHNAFGRCLAQFSTIFAVYYFTSEKRSVFYSTIWFLTVVLTLMTGSRNAFLAEFVSIIFVYAFVQKQKGNTLSKVMRGLIVLSILLLIANVILPDIGLIADRFNFSTLIATGGTNRTTIWKRLIPLILKEYTWFGYGPGYYCSAQIVSSLVNRAYTNSHNIIIEVWGELGLIGLVCFIGLLIKSMHRAYVDSQKNMCALFIIALLVDILINGIGEAMFAGTNLWIIVGLCYGLISDNNKHEESEYGY